MEGIIKTFCAQLYLPLKSTYNTIGTKDSKVTTKTCGTIGKRVQVNLVWVRDLGVGNAFQLKRLGVMKMKSRIRGSLWHYGLRMLKNTSIRGVTKKL